MQFSYRCTSFSTGYHSSSPPHHLLFSSLSHCFPCLPFSTTFSSHSFLPPFLSSLRSFFLWLRLSRFPLTLYLSLFLFLHPVDMSGITRVGPEGSSSSMFSSPHTMISSGENLSCLMMRYTTLLCNAMYGDMMWCCAIQSLQSSELLRVRLMMWGDLKWRFTLWLHGLCLWVLALIRSYPKPHDPWAHTIIENSHLLF